MALQFFSPALNVSALFFGVNMNKEFEKLPEIVEIFKGLHPTIIWFCDKSNKYATSFSGFDDRVMWLNGALFAYQERQKLIDKVNHKLVDLHAYAGMDDRINSIIDEIKGLLK